MAAPLALVASVAGSKKQSSWQLVISARDSLWARWHDHRAIDSYDLMARSDMVQGWWNHLSDWIEVEPSPCDVCSHYQPVCVVCGSSARYFIDDERSAHLCDVCIAAKHRMDEVLADAPEDGSYACCDGCLCDTWA